MNLDNLNQEAVAAIRSAQDPAQLERVRLKYLGRKGVVTELLRRVGTLPARERASSGAAANELHRSIAQALGQAETRLGQAKLAQEVSEQPMDLTLPAPQTYGHIHPISSTLNELVQIFWQMGYAVIEGPEVETEWYNFEALLVNADHPARDMQDTFYLEQGNLPRTHTSGVQIRYMEHHKPPIRIVSTGKVYRNEDEDARHTWMFNQIEGLVVDEGVRLSDLKGTLLAMMRGLLGPDTQIRLRPSYFPYTEPSVELDATCVICHGKGCNTCSGTGWLELGGAGMVHPSVLRNVGIDPQVYSGFAFGFGPERIAAIKYQVPDIREFWRPNLKFLEQFS
jgi:phenylalanyl-tRNA synthetase alpha chain